MPSSTTRRRKGHGEVVPPLTLLDRIDSLLKEHLATFPSKGELTEKEIENWHKDLGGYQISAIEYAFDTWRRNGRFFPVPYDIISLCDSFNPKTRLEFDPAEYRHHGMGHIHILALWEKVSQRVQAFKDSGKPYEPLTHDEITVLLQQVASKDEVAA